jgi:apolipoprotein D and lipocalin family protein
MNKATCLLLGALWALPACASTKNLPEQRTVDHVELPRFMGRWYVIAAIPTRFEKGAVNATETYTWNQTEDRVDIDFRYNQDSRDGKEKKIPQKGFIYNKETNAEWRIQPFWPLKFAYLIVSLAPDYSDTIIGVPDRSNVWIMARGPRLTESRYEQLVAKVKTLGYDLSELVRVPQEW